jgi:ubiquinone/menaquinone biosynthesis C-methylase UbiE
MDRVRYGSAMKRRLRRARFLVGLRGLALVRGWPFGDPDEADDQIDAVREVLDQGDPEDAFVDVEELDLSEAYALWSETYDGPNPLIAAEEPIVRDLIGQFPPGRALDAATGTGRHARLLRDLGHRVVGVDGSPEMIERARQNAPDVALVRSDLRALPFRDASIDLVMCALALTHLAMLTEPICELARVLRPGGRLIVSDIHPVAVATGAHAFFLRADGSRGVLRNELHWPSEYVAAFRAAELTVERLIEPPFDESFVEQMPEAAVRDAAREAVVGLPFALVWRLRKTAADASGR